MKSILDELQPENEMPAPQTDDNHASSESVMSGQLERSLSLSITRASPATQLLFFNKLNIHTPDAGINPLVDSAAYIFHLMGKLHEGDDDMNLALLHDELVEQIKHYQDAVYTCHYNQQLISEYIPTTTYALCFALDDIIMDATYGDASEWKQYSLVQSFFSEQPSRQSFMLILERLVMDPAIYIDAIEFMYICMSFAFKRKNILSHCVFEYDEAEEIAEALYKRIIACRGYPSKTLSPYPIRPQEREFVKESTFTYTANWQTAIAACSVVVMVVISGIGYVSSYIKPHQQAKTLIAKKVTKEVVEPKLIKVAMND